MCALSCCECAGWNPAAATQAPTFTSVSSIQNSAPCMLSLAAHIHTHTHTTTAGGGDYVQTHGLGQAAATSKTVSLAAHMVRASRIQPDPMHTLSSRWCWRRSSPATTRHSCTMWPTVLLVTCRGRGSTCMCCDVCPGCNSLISRAAALMPRCPRPTTRTASSEPRRSGPWARPDCCTEPFCCWREGATAGTCDDCVSKINKHMGQLSACCELLLLGVVCCLQCCSATTSQARPYQAVYLWVHTFWVVFVFAAALTATTTAALRTCTCSSGWYCTVGKLRLLLSRSKAFAQGTNLLLCTLQCCSEGRASNILLAPTRMCWVTHGPEAARQTDSI